MTSSILHAAAFQPLPHPTDKVYWSHLPKVRHIQKPHPHSSLGISIMTREVGSKSQWWVQSVGFKVQWWVQSPVTGSRSSGGQ